MRAALIITDGVLGGPEWLPMLRLTLGEDGGACLAALDQHSSAAGSMTFDVWHRRTLQWSQILSQGCYALADAGKMQALADEAAPLLDRVHAGHTVQWSGSSFVGALNADAQAASDELKALLDGADWLAALESLAPRRYWDAIFSYGTTCGAPRL